MKKVMALLLTFSMLWVTMAGTFALEDIQKETLYDLGIMVGDETGELHLERTITRAEAAKMICVAGNITPQTAFSEADGFADVSAIHWAFPYICALKEAGIVNGDENGHFNPENEITNEEIVKMIVALLGYTEMAIARGGYPAGYTAQAGVLGVTKGMQLAVNVPAIRNDVGLMICQALDVPLMVMEEEGIYVISNGKNDVPLRTLRMNLEK